MLDGRTSPVVKVVGKASTSNFEKHFRFLCKAFVLEDIDHVEYIEALVLGKAHHALKEVLLTVVISILYNVVETVRGINFIVPRSDSVSMLVFEGQIRRVSVL